jgi:hypothetical protein
LTESGLKHEQLEKNKKKKYETFGWDGTFFYVVFNDETLYRSYKKKLNEMPFYKEHYEREMETGESELSEEVHF